MSAEQMAAERKSHRVMIRDVVALGRRIREALGDEDANLFLALLDGNGFVSGLDAVEVSGTDGGQEKQEQK